MDCCRFNKISEFVLYLCYMSMEIKKIMGNSQSQGF